MNLASSMMLVANLVRRPLSSGPLSQSEAPSAGWIIDPAGSDRFDILASRGNGTAPALTSTNDLSLQIGVGSWQITAIDPNRFRILSSLSNPSVTAAPTQGDTLISIGT
jgi:hypothetical protein